MKPLNRFGWLLAASVAIVASGYRPARRSTTVPTFSSDSSPFGVVWYAHHVNDYPGLAVELDSVQAAGIGWISIAVNWAGLESTQGTISYDAIFDSVVSFADARGIKILAKIEGSPDWARAGCPTYSSNNRTAPDSQHYGAWRRMVGEMVRRWPTVTTWTVWNEVSDTTLAAAPGGFSPCYGYINSTRYPEYENLVRAVSDTVHAYGGKVAAYESNVLFMDSIAASAARLGSALDIIAMHIYQPSYNGVLTIYDSLPAVLAASPNTNLKLWVTEAGFSDRFGTSYNEELLHRNDIFAFYNAFTNVRATSFPQWEKSFAYSLNNDELGHPGGAYNRALISETTDVPRLSFFGYKYFIQSYYDIVTLSTIAHNGGGVSGWSYCVSSCTYGSQWSDGTWSSVGFWGSATTSPVPYLDWFQFGVTDALRASGTAICYQAHQSYIGWQGSVTCNQGPTGGSANPIESVRLWLINPLPRLWSTYNTGTRRYDSYVSLCAQGRVQTIGTQSMTCTSPYVSDSLVTTYGSSGLGSEVWIGTTGQAKWLLGYSLHFDGDYRQPNWP